MPESVCGSIQGMLNIYENLISLTDTADDSRVSKRAFDRIY